MMDIFLLSAIEVGRESIGENPRIAFKGAEFRSIFARKVLIEVGGFCRPAVVELY